MSVITESKAFLDRTITLGELLELAAWLASEDGENPEYDRALAELWTDAAGLSQEEWKETVLTSFSMVREHGNERP